MNFLDRLAPKHGWLDLIVLVTLLGMINVFVSGKDFGWTQFNPSPWLLVPVLIGCRYGFAFGVTGALVVMLLIGGTIMWRQDLILPQILLRHGDLFAGLVVAGGICGELQRGLRRREILLSAQNQRAQEQLKRTDADLFLLRETKAELERVMATHDAELSTLDEEIRRLGDSEGDELWQDLLLLLHRQVRMSDAGIYSLSTDGRTLLRKGLLGNAPSLPEELALKDVEMVQLALRQQTTVTVPEFWRRTRDLGQEQAHLLVTPLLGSRGQVMAVLVVAGMPFISLTKKTVHLVALICGWASRVMEMGSETETTARAPETLTGQRIFTRPFFQKNLDLAVESHQRHGLPSAIVMFRLPLDAGASQRDLESTIMPQIRGGDYPCELDLPFPHLAVLLPLSGERGTETFVDRVLSACRKETDLGNLIQVRVIPIQSVTNLESLMTELVKHAA